MFELPKLDWLKKYTEKIHFFGLGFIQLKVNATLRFHFYTKRLVSIMPTEEIHNHRYNFTSYILKGELRNEIFDVVPGDGYFLSETDCKEGSTPHVGHMSWAVIPAIDVTLAPGSSYYLKHHTYHRVSSDNCITKLEIGSPMKDRAGVCRPKGAKAVCPFSCKTPEDALWDIVEDMLGV
jgi:hypothetical protein